MKKGVILVELPSDILIKISKICKNNQDCNKLFYQALKEFLKKRK
ncbi:MAG: hypothetical protein ABIH37_04325 [archaeon]